MYDLQTTGAFDTDAFDTEAQLVDQFIVALRAGTTCWGRLEVAAEWAHGAGSVDVLCRNRTKKLLAFEAKLADWRGAFHQAFRNGTYADRVYVVLPRKIALTAAQHRAQFEARGIGLCSVRMGRVYVHIRAGAQPQLLTWITRRAHRHFDGAFDECGDADRSRRRLLRGQPFSVGA